MHHDHERIELPKRNDYLVEKQVHLVDSTKTATVNPISFPSQWKLYNELELCLKYFLKTRQEQ